MIDKIYLKELFKHIEITLNENQLESFDKYAKLLVEWNEKINLTAITEPKEVCEKHFLDSVMPFALIKGGLGTNEFMNKTIIDVGTGAGFPSCPLKIVDESLNLTLLDSLNKRIKFLESISNELLLKATCIHGRAEELGNKSEYREKFDIATARAVANLSDLCEYCLPLVKKGGYFIALKGSAGTEEANKAKSAIKTLGGMIQEIKEYTLPNGDGRTVIVIKKVSATPAKYPRNKGQMKKKPL
ncbi:MAG: 16S rRNA (guanine(527)-N(7))-methyltransferase RsmG [Clostridiales bacterium]|nr:16S rRNA (guanine(527)-N(7))-methyltransferase RsmG [Clostridiales bacterium]